MQRQLPASASHTLFFVFCLRARVSKVYEDLSRIIALDRRLLLRWPCAERRMFRTIRQCIRVLRKPVCRDVGLMLCSCKSPWCDFTGDRGSTKSSESDRTRTDRIRVYSEAIDEYKKKNYWTCSSTWNL